MKSKLADKCAFHMLLTRKFSRCTEYNRSGLSTAACRSGWVMMDSKSGSKYSVLKNHSVLISKLGKSKIKNAKFKSELIVESQKFLAMLLLVEKSRFFKVKSLFRILDLEAWSFYLKSFSEFHLSQKSLWDFFTRSTRSWGSSMSRDLSNWSCSRGSTSIAPNTSKSSKSPLKPKDL